MLDVGDFRANPKAPQFGLFGVCAVRYGNGLIDLSSRANLQLRGVRPEALQELTSELHDLGILDATPGAEAAPDPVQEAPAEEPRSDRRERPGR